MSHSKRVILIGIDGATFHIITPLIEAGKLPTIHRLMKSGSYGTLQAPLLASSPAGWTSVVTAQNPGRHNIFDYYNGFNGTYQRPLASSADVRSEQIWKMLGRYGLRSVIVNAPMTYPPDPLRGVMVCGLPFQSKKKFTFPSYLTGELVQQKYCADFFDAYSSSLSDYLKIAHQTMTNRQKLFSELLIHHEWALAMIVFTTIDRLQMLFWQDQELINSYYIKLDKLLGNILGHLDDNIHVMLVSPYGYKSVKKKFFVNEWLWEQGLLTRSVSTDRASIANFYQDYFINDKSTGHWVTTLLANSHITKDNIRSIIPDTMCEIAKRLTPPSLRKVFPRENLIIHWESTKAYFPSYMTPGININLSGREPRGIVQSGSEYENLRDQIIRELYRLKDPYTFENVIVHVYRREEIFSGDCIDHAPDILFIPRNYDFYLDPNKRSTRNCIGQANDDYPVFGGRSPHGVIVMNGPEIRSNYHVTEFTSTDVLPTIMQLLDLPIPEGLDGTLRNDVFEKYEPTAGHSASASADPIQRPEVIFDQDDT